jgi:co-chaperonin GroES (HSP10)
MTKINPTPDIQPLGARVLIQPLEQQSRTASGIILPESSNLLMDQSDILARVN